jgi:hypothetical protein
MAAEDAPAKAAGGALGALKTKLGPLPIGAWGAIALVIWYYIQHRKAAASTAGQQTDSAGNTGTIDPATGYVYGSTQDQAGLAARNSNNSNPSSGGAGSGATTAGQYATNADWGRAAVNLLVGLGVDPTTANQAIQLYLQSQTLTPDQQGSVNLAIQALGAPPQLPGPSTANPAPVVTPPGGGGGAPPSASNPPTGLAVGNITGTAISLKWNAVTNATGYTVSYGIAPADTTWTTTAPGAGVTSGQVTNPGITVGNLKPGTAYAFKVQATPVGASGGWAGPITATTSK